MNRHARRFSVQFKLGKSQSELDFVDVDLNGDVPLFLDPYALHKRDDDRWAVESSNLVVDFFETVVNAIRAGGNGPERARDLLERLGEPKDTFLGVSRSAGIGHGVSGKQSSDLYASLAGSAAVRTGFLKDLEDCELMVPGIAFDKISDITTNIIRAKLVEYTQAQCDLHGVPMQSVASGRFWDDHSHDWSEGAFTNLPAYKDQRILLVPKVIARRALTLTHSDYYNNFVLTYLQREHLSANTALVRLLKNGKRKVYKKDLKKIQPGTKPDLYEFSRQHPSVLSDYKVARAKAAQAPPAASSTLSDDIDGLIDELPTIPSGTATASRYHNLMIGVVEALFYPDLVHPRKEQSLHEGRKRIDITATNVARDGFFSWLHRIHKVPSSFVMFECKNYREDPANPELDQLAGRFSPNRGKVGFLVCRHCDDRTLFRKRASDTARDDRGYIIMLTDEDVAQLLVWKRDGSESKISKFLDDEFRRLVF